MKKTGLRHNRPVFLFYCRGWETASGTPAQGLPQIVINNDVFCTAGGKDYVLKEAYYDGARFAVKTTKYGTPSVYGVNADLACWGGVVGLYSDSWDRTCSISSILNSVRSS